MKIALIGYGNMGQMIEKIALSRGHTIVVRISSNQWDYNALEEAETCIEFSHPECVLENIKKLAELKKEIIIGTTGWHDKIEAVRSLVEKHRIGALYSPNFSIGVNLLMEIIASASKLINGFDEYAIAGVELHHQHKTDAPSGTAIAIAEIVEKNVERVEKLPFASVRCGSIPGTHTLLFDSPCDTISITHEARNREGFAKGAVMAAEWLKGKKGLYTFADCIKERRLS
jgi:4-hydroxy-tetrahydrodipicolinate reductase